MALLKQCTIQEQSPNMLAQVQVDTSIYATSSIGSVTIRFGRDAPTYVVAGVQTSVTHTVILDVFNASHGNAFLVRRGTSANTGSALINIVNGTFGGQVLGILNPGTSTNAGMGAESSAIFNGVTGAWQA
jgi:hypothetical protein